MKPMFSIVTVCRDSAHVLPGALASLAEQRYGVREWVVIDGGSTDGTQDLVRFSGEVLGDWVSEPDAGIYNAMNKGWRRARGEIVYYLNSDDAFASPEVLDLVAAAFARDRDVDLVIGQVIYRYPDGRRLLRDYRHVRGDALIYEDLCHQAVFARRRLFEAVGGFDERFRINADYDWLIRVFRTGARVTWLDLPVAFFSTGGAHVRNVDQLIIERRAVRLQYVTASSLAVGLFFRRVLSRLRRFVGLRPRGQLPAPEAK